MIAKTAFLDEDVLARESASLFGAGFVFVGLTSELANKRDFVTVDYAGTRWGGPTCASANSNPPACLRAAAAGRAW